MGIRFILIVNKQGQKRLAQYYEYPTIKERQALEGEIICKCLARTEQQVPLSFSCLHSSYDEREMEDGLEYSKKMRWAKKVHFFY